MGRCSRLLGRVLRGTLRLQLLRMKDTIAPKTAFGEGLGVVLESIRRRLGSAVDDGQALDVFDQHELHSGATQLDRPWLHISRNRQALAGGAVAPEAQLFGAEASRLRLRRA